MGFKGSIPEDIIYLIIFLPFNKKIQVQLGGFLQVHIDIYIPSRFRAEMRVGAKSWVGTKVWAQKIIRKGVKVLLFLAGALASSFLPHRERLQQVQGLIIWFAEFKDEYILLLNGLADPLGWKLLKL